MAGTRAAKPVAKNRQQAISKALIEARKRLKAGDVVAVQSIVAQVLNADPMNLDAMHLRAAVLIGSGDYSGAAQMLRSIVKLKPNHVDARIDLGDVLRRLGQYQDAEGHLRDAIKLKPRHAGAWLNLGNVYQAWSRLVDAETAYLSATKYAPELGEVWGNLSSVQLTSGKPDESASAARKAIKFSPRNGLHHSRLALALDRSGDEPGAMAAHEAAIALAPDAVQARISQARSLAQFGHLDEAIAALRRLLEVFPGHVGAYVHISRLKKFSDPEDADIARMRALAARPGISDGEVRAINFALGKALEDCRQYGEAFACFELANQVTRKHLQYVRTRTSEMFADVRAAHPGGTSDGLANLAQTAAPIFIVGMPRSGTSLVEQIIAQHPDVHGAGELAAFPEGTGQLLQQNQPHSHVEMMRRLNPGALAQAAERYLGITGKLARDGRRVADKMPSNFIHIRLIKLMFPDARIVHCARSPAEVALSLFKTNFSTGNVPYSFDLDDIAHYLAEYQAHMAHWQKVRPDDFMTVKYEELVADQVGQSKRLLSWCGLDWRDEVLDFHSSKTPVHTASIAQVRQPIHSGSVGLATRYGDAAAPLFAALERGGVK